MRDKHIRTSSHILQMDACPYNNDYELDTEAIYTSKNLNKNKIYLIREIQIKYISTQIIYSCI